MKSEGILLTNTWTHARHGHAQDELLTIKNFVASNFIESYIVSITPSFGDINSFSIGTILKNFKLDHSKFLKNIVDENILRDISRSINKARNSSIAHSPTLAITSSRFHHIFGLQRSISKFKQIRVRLLDAPDDDVTWKALSAYLESFKHKPIVALEVKSSVKASEKYLDDVMYLPSHYGLQFEGSDVNVARNKLGIFWPVGRSFTDTEVETLLEQVKSFAPVVKLPNGLKTSVIKNKFPEIEFIPNGLNQREFRKILSEIKVAILGHKSYFNQSSGYVGYFLANNVPVVVSKTNSFYEEFMNKGQLYAIEDLKSLTGLIHECMNAKLNLNKNQFCNEISLAWKNFLFGEGI